MTATAAALSYRQTPERTTCLLAGDWRADARQPETAPPSWQAGTALDFDCSALGEWDSSLLARVLQIAGAAGAAGCQVDLAGLPGGLARLVRLAAAVPRREQPVPVHENGVLDHVGRVALAIWSRIPQTLAFVGELSRSLARLAGGKAGFQRADLLLFLEDAGPRALPIVSLISFLVGTILAYMGAAQLAMFGAQIYIANLVGVGMVREIAALMTGIILAGRTGAAYAAQLGTMQVNEEIDALRTFGLPASDFLVLPRFLALVAMAPLLTLYAGLVGIVAGMLIATTVFDVGAYAYYTQTLQALSLTHIAVGLIKGTVYGALVAVAGCLCGMRCGRSAQAVGEATTAAVVLGILLITVSASLLTILFQRLGI
ncbi:ABC transporter permease [Azonexus sp. R2A61]|uniref:ABC transporter permease n=1 Tax=Azonexus sp. R2A61 TaxID=2744443 RepID=UPI001F274C37|nr:ABC transporter permease [Azonexus sp. R2A61]